MPANVTIRPATASDVAALAGLVAEYWSFERIDGFDDARMRTLLEWLFDRPSLGGAWIAEDGGRAVGYLVTVYVFSLEHGGMTAEIDEFYLQAESRGSATGRRLLETAEAEFRRTGCTNVSLQLGRGNEAGRRFYERLGYRLRDGYRLMDKMLVPGDGSRD